MDRLRRSLEYRLVEKLIATEEALNIANETLKGNKLIGVLVGEIGCSWRESSKYHSIIRKRLIIEKVGNNL